MRRWRRKRRPVSMLLHKLMIWTICLYAAINFNVSPRYGLPFSPLQFLPTPLSPHHLFHSISLLLCIEASHLNSVRMEYIKVKSSHCVSLITIFCCFLQNAVIVCLVCVYHSVRLAWACVCVGACVWIETEISECETETETENEWSWTKWLKVCACVCVWASDRAR